MTISNFLIVNSSLLYDLNHIISTLCLINLLNTTLRCLCNIFPGYLDLWLVFSGWFTNYLLNNKDINFFQSELENWQLIIEAAKDHLFFQSQIYLCDPEITSVPITNFRFLDLLFSSSKFIQLVGRFGWLVSEFLSFL